MTTSETIKQPGVLDWALKEWQSGHGGPLATGVSGTSFLSLTSIAPHIEGATTIQSVEEKVSQARASEGIMKQLQIQKRVFLDKAEADIQISFGSTGFNVHDTGHSLALLFQHHDPGNYAGAAVGSTHAFSRGSCHISGPNPKLDPTIDPGYMSNPADIDILADGILFIQKIFETGPLAALIKDHPNGNGKLFQPSMKLESRLDKVMAVEWVKETAISSWHPIGTCSMLPRVDGGVVDTQLKVYGTANLRVVDASIMPLHIRGNIQTSVYAIAERAADIIKEGFPRKSV
jgi:choline dehydrogenase